jgi:hypothetical protein
MNENIFLSLEGKLLPLDKHIYKLVRNKTVDWNTISRHYELPLRFISKYKDELNWYYICMYQNLTEKFIEKHIDYVDFFNLVKYQKLSDKFCLKYKENISEYSILSYQKLSSYSKEYQKHLVIKLLNGIKHYPWSIKDELHKMTPYMKELYDGFGIML